MEDLIAQLNADKNYFEKELIDMQMKQDDMLEELKRKDKEIYDLQKESEQVQHLSDSKSAQLRDLESGRTQKLENN